MKTISRTHVLALMLAYSLTGLIATTGPNLIGQVTPPNPYVLDDGQAGVTVSLIPNTNTPTFTRIGNTPSHGGFALMYRGNAQIPANVDYLFENLDQTADYAVYATWEPTLAFTTSALHRVTGATVVPTDVNQQVEPAGTAPNGTTHLNRTWQKIATVKPSAGRTIRVTVVGDFPTVVGQDVYTQADAIMIVKLDAPQTNPNEPRIIDDGDTGYTSSGIARRLNIAAYEGDYMECYHSPFGGGAGWDFENMDTTAAYEVYTTWLPASDLNPNLPFRLTPWANSNATITTYINQTIAPTGITHAGRTWQKIGYISLATPNSFNRFSVNADCTLHGVLDAVMAVRVTPSVCGNNTTENGEECDDGNNVHTDACRLCKNAKCGDYSIQAGVETCDDGNNVNTDACPNSCQTARCGDTIVRTIVETCDDGNTVNTDSCSNACQNARCGDTIVQTGEQCDDGNQNNDDSCRNNCTTQGCGNGTVDPGEQCDDGNAVNTDTCTTLCRNPICGDGHRQGNEQCDDGNTRTFGDGCTNLCKTQVCGDGIISAQPGYYPETCDGGSQSNTTSWLGCNRQTCQVTGGSFCGNGVPETRADGSREDCDDGNGIDTDACNNLCETYPYVCGNGRTQAGEQCDDGNQVDGDGCSPTCRTQAITQGCGNGTIEPVTEVCDNGTQNVAGYDLPPGQCSTACRRTGNNVCGNGTVNPGEQCDDGNSTETDNCTNGCRTGRMCGNSYTDAEEQCDDGNTLNTDGCTANCRTAICGDNHIQLLVEQCDDGNQNNDDACNNTCRNTVCGDGITQGYEQCDDNNRVTDDACTNACNNARCGDGITRTNVEQCDDGNTNNGDGCSNTCALPSCGDGTTQAGEQCDDNNTVNTDGCTNACRSAVCGDGITRPTHEGCDDGNMESNDACRNDCTLPPTGPVCGDGTVQTGEGCDDGNQVDADGCRNNCTARPLHPLCGNIIVEPGETCEMPPERTDRRIPGRTPPAECDLLCHFNSCGDGVRHAQLGEQCDDGNQINTDACSNICQNNVMAPLCRNGTINAGEQCDDNNAVNTDGCTNACQNARCGDQIVRPSNEQCDDGNTVNTDACSNTCQNARCGDTIVQANEQCDDGNTVNTDACNNVCQNNVTAPLCRNGTINPGEQCDDNNAVNTDGCTNACQNARCGDQIVRANVEACDDGNQIDTDACRNNCTLPPPPASCGNNVINAGEQCDDNNQVNTDACTATCQNARCGDQIVWANVEQCDDGNQIDTDACRNNCQSARCGDTIVQAGEQCDDGNQINTDACSNACTNTTGGTTAALTIRNIDIGPSRGATVNYEGPVIGLSFQTLNQAVSVTRLQFKALQGNLTNGFEARMYVDTNNDGRGDQLVSVGTIQSGRAVFTTFTTPFVIPANSTRIAEIRLKAVYYMTNVHLIPQQVSPQGPVQIDLDTAAANYVRAVYANTTSQLTNIATNGTCNAAPCAIAVFTGPTNTLTFRTTGTVTVIGEQPAATSQILAGDESETLTSFTVRTSNHEEIIWDQAAFYVEGGESVERLAIYVYGVEMESATPAECADMTYPPGQPIVWNGHNIPTHCIVFGNRPLLSRNADNQVEIRAVVKTPSAAWRSGAKVKITLLTQREGYVGFSGDVSTNTLTTYLPSANYGEISYSGNLFSNPHEAVFAKIEAVNNANIDAHGTQIRTGVSPIAFYTLTAAQNPGDPAEASKVALRTLRFEVEAQNVELEQYEGYSVYDVRLPSTRYLCTGAQQLTATRHLVECTIGNATSTTGQDGIVLLNGESATVALEANVLNPRVNPMQPSVLQVSLKDFGNITTTNQKTAIEWQDFHDIPQPTVWSQGKRRGWTDIPETEILSTRYIR